MTNLKKLCEEYFGSRDFYDILNVDKKATSQEIKKSYYKLSLSVHPDRVEESEKAYATEKFKILGKIHSILQDPDKRKIYDESGDFDEESYDTCNWINYWRSIFKKITIEDIIRYEKEYIGSEEEKMDIKKAYIASKGNMDRILELVPFSSYKSEPRIIEIVQKFVDNGEVEAYKTFFNEPKSKKLRRHNKYKKEEKLCKDIDFEELSNQIAKNQEDRAKNFNDLVSSLEAKYSGNSKSKKRAITNGSGEDSPAKRNGRSMRSRKNK